MKNNVLNLSERKRANKIKMNGKSQKKTNIWNISGHEESGFFIETDEWGFPIE